MKMTNPIQTIVRNNTDEARTFVQTMFGPVGADAHSATVLDYELWTAIEQASQKAALLQQLEEGKVSLQLRVLCAGGSWETIPYILDKTPKAEPVPATASEEPKQEDVKPADQNDAADEPVTTPETTAVSPEAAQEAPATTAEEPLAVPSESAPEPEVVKTTTTKKKKSK